MDTDTRIAELIRGLDADQLAEFVDELSEGERETLDEIIPPPSSAHLDDTPVDLAARIDGSYRRLPHIEVLGTAIHDTISEAHDGTGPGRLIVNMPPRVGKSTTTSLWTPTWFLDRWPDRHVILTTHTHNYAVSWGRKVRDLIRREDAIRRVKVASGATKAGEWETTLGGGMLSTGVGGAITGRGAHLLIIDDPLKGFVDAHSQAVRQHQWEWWLGDASTRLEPGAAVVVLMTRWHEDDLVGRLLSDEWEGDPDEWTVVRIPAVGEEPDPTVAPDALDRDPDVPLLLPQDDTETADDAAIRWKRERESRGPYMWHALYQQRPSEPEGTILKASWWQFYETPPASFDAVIHSWDMAFKATDSSSYVVGQVWGRLGANRYLLDQVRGRWNFPETRRQVRALAERHPDYVRAVVEDKANGPAVVDDLRDTVRGLVARSPQGDKEQRAHGVSGDIEAGNVWLPSPDVAPWVRDLVQECADFPTGAHDDQVDALTQALLELRKGGPSEIHSPDGSRRELAAQGAKTAVTRRTINRR